MTTSPRQRFLETAELARIHREATASEPLLRAAELALLHFVRQLDDTTDPVVAAAQWQQVAGARRAIDIFMTLADPAKKPDKPHDIGNLRHDV